MIDKNMSIKGGTCRRNHKETQQYIESFFDLI